jgi:hypothetical protein
MARMSFIRLGPKNRDKGPKNRDKGPKNKDRDKGQRTGTFSVRELALQGRIACGGCG